MGILIKARGVDSFCLDRKLENVEGLLSKHSLASAPDLEDRLAAWDRKQVQACTEFPHPYKSEWKRELLLPPQGLAMYPFWTHF